MQISSKNNNINFTSIPIENFNFYNKSNGTKLPAVLSRLDVNNLDDI